MPEFLYTVRPTRPTMLVDGTFCLESRAVEPEWPEGDGNETMDLLLLEEQLLGSSARAAAF